MNILYSLISVFLISNCFAQSSSNQCMALANHYATKPNYCDEPKQPHLGCDASEKWAKSCGRHPKLLSMTKSLRTFLENKHNVYRNIVAKGTLRQVPASARMLKLKWENNLAALAELAVKRCQLSLTTESYSTPNFTDPGILAAYTTYSKNENPEDKEIISEQLRAFFDEYKYMTPDRLQERYPSGPEVGHFLQLVYGLNDRFGCAVSKFKKGKLRYQLMVCLYGCHKQPGKPTYLIGKVPASKCQCGADIQFKNLCSAKESVGDCGLIQPEYKDSDIIYMDKVKIKPATTTRRLQENPIEKKRCWWFFCYEIF